MSRYIKINHLFVKIFKEEKYAKNFINDGEMHFSDFSYLRDEADVDSIDGNRFYRGDPNEGFYYKEKNKVIDKQGKIFDSVKIVFQNKYKSLFSLYAFDANDLDLKDNYAKKEILSKEMKSFGDYAVIIKDNKKFTLLIEKLMKDSINADFVKYIPKFEFDKTYNVFHKISVEFEYQKEFRIVNKNLELNDKNNFYLGSLEGIAYLTNTDSLIDEVEFFVSE